MAAGCQDVFYVQCLTWWLIDPTTLPQYPHPLSSKLPFCSWKSTIPSSSHTSALYNLQKQKLDEIHNRVEYVDSNSCIECSIYLLFGGGGGLVIITHQSEKSESESGVNMNDNEGNMAAANNYIKATASAKPGIMLKVSFLSAQVIWTPR